VSGRQKSQCPGDSDVCDEASGYKEDDDPLMTRKTAEPSMDGMSNQHQWDPFDQEIDSAHPHHQEAAPRVGMNQYVGNPANQFISMRSQSHSFASGGTKESELNAQAAMNYDPFPYQQQSGSYRDRGYSDPSPMSNHHLGPHSAYSMHPAPARQEYYSSNINQYAPQHHHSQSQQQQFHQHDAHSHHDMSHDYWYRNPNYNNYHSAQGLAQAQGYAQAPGANTTTQPHSPAQGDRNHTSPDPLPTFSPLKSFQEDEGESDSKPKPQT